MKKPRMLYASPFWPLKSGIANYSSGLVNALASYFDITLLTDNYTISDKSLKGFPIIRHQPGNVYSEFDVIFYNIGNQPDYHGYMIDAMHENPGFVILHDFSIYYLSIGVAQQRGAVFQEIYNLSGVDGIQLAKDSLREYHEPNLLLHKHLADQLPLNRGLIESAKGILVHSDFSIQQIQTVSKTANLCRIHHLTIPLPSGTESANEVAKKLWGIPENAFVIVAAGFIAPTKQNVLTCKAVKRYNDLHDEKVYYLMVGEGSDADSYLGQYCIKTGFASDQIYAQALRRADVVFNLRFPTNGETSGTMIQAMQLGKTCVTTDIGWFGELPDDVVIKVQPDVTPEKLAELILELRQGKYKTMGARALDYIDENCAPQKVARSIYEFLSRTND